MHIYLRVWLMGTDVDRCIDNNAKEAQYPTPENEKKVVTHVAADCLPIPQFVSVSY